MGTALGIAAGRRAIYGATVGRGGRGVGGVGAGVGGSGAVPWELSQMEPCTTAPGASEPRRPHLVSNKESYLGL
jgi:hypothetical protein